MALLCPVCRTQMVQVEHTGISLDVCPECAGIWFDSGELLELSKARPGSMEQLDSRFLPNLEIISPEPMRKSCPRCQTPLERHKYSYDAPVNIDSCPKGHGVFVEDQELASIQQAIKDEDRAHITAVMEARSRLSGRPAPTTQGRDRDTDVAALIHALAHWRERSQSNTS